MKYCIHCGHEIGLDTTSCPYCSKEISENDNNKVFNSNIKCVNCGSNNVNYMIKKIKKNDIMYEKSIYSCSNCNENFSDEDRLGSSFSNNFHIILGDKLKKTIKFLLTFGIILYILIKFNVFGGISNSGLTTYDYVQDCNGLQTVKLVDIYHAYNNNKDTATEMYVNKPFVFEGEIFRINNDKTMIQIDSEEISPEVYINKEEQSKLDKYKEGDTIRVCGIVKTKKTLIAVPIFVENATIIEK